MPSPAARRRPCLLAGALLVAALAAPVRAEEPPAPLPAQPTASGEARIAPAPVRIEVPAGERKAQAMGEVAPGRDAEFLFDAPADAMVSVGVASKSGEARVSVYDAGKDEAYPGTEREAGAIRWVGSMTSGEKLSIVVHTQGQETPVRVEVSLDPTSAR